MSQNRKARVYSQLRENARVLYAQGASRRYVALALEIADSTAAEWANQLGYADMVPTLLPPRGVKRRNSAVARHFRELQMKAVELFRSGLSTREVAHRPNAPVSTVATWKAKAQIARRPSRSIAPPPFETPLCQFLESVFSDKDSNALEHRSTCLSGLGKNDLCNFSPSPPVGESRMPACNLPNTEAIQLGDVLRENAELKRLLAEIRLLSTARLRPRPNAVG